MRRTIRTLLACALLAGCTEPYATPETDRDFRGVAAYIAPGAPPPRLILTHGMCSDLHRAEPGRDWVGARAALIAEALGGRFDETPPYAVVTYPAGRPPDAPGVQRYDFTLAGTRGSVEVSFLTWGRHVDASRRALAYENTSAADTPGAPVRARLNAGLKTELMNRCLIDAVTYLGPRGDPIRRDMRAALCDILGGSFKPADPAGSASRPARCTGIDPDGATVILIPESLGATILFEAFAALDDRAGGFDLAQRLGQVRAIYLASNQLPLLELASRLPPDEIGVARAGDGRAAAELSGLDAFVAILARAPVPRSADGRREPVQLVAITDPNDVLGYRIRPDRFGDNAPITVHNVLVSNAPTALGAIANPAAAHRNTARPEIYRLLMEGSAAGPGG